MNFLGSLPVDTASEMRNSIIDDVVGLSFRKLEIDGKVISSYASQTATAPTNIKNIIFVQYHILTSE